jgi:predicted signal transduction protein with EAL and GGDEF domain/DNA-binding response OmpR family regulator
MNDSGTSGARATVVLVVDDDETMRVWAGACLGNAGFAVIEAADGAEALRVLERADPEVIMLDVEMPNLDGFATCRRIRELPGFTNTPIIMVTGRDDTVSIERAYAAGATDFATKPINWSLLHHRLRYILRASQTVDELADSQAKLNDAQRIAGLGSWEWTLHDDRVSWSHGMYWILGLQPQAVPPSRAALIERVIGHQRGRLEETLGDVLGGGQPARLCHSLVRPDGSARVVQHRIERLSDARGVVTGLRATLQDITEIREAEEQIRRLAYFDSLTGLRNRESFQERAQQEVERAKRHGRRLAAVFLDLDNFKRVNDTLGHRVGDLLLKSVARRLVHSVRSSDLVVRCDGEEGEQPVARLGGDEFTVLLMDVAGGKDAAAVAERILQAVSQPLSLSGHDVSITASIGLALFPQDGNDAESLLKNADTAMYFAKREGKNLFRFYDETMNVAALRRLQLEASLRRALDRDELLLHYQPQIDLASGAIEGVEALLRWRCPDVGEISPAEFIPLAEETGLIIPIGAWVLRTACAQLKAWRCEGLAIGRVAVNISVLQFVQQDFPRLIQRVLAETGLEPERLELEITESLLAKDVDGAVRTLASLKGIGVHLSIDDFGTGYSSLSQLKRFPIDRLKIDRSFVCDVTSDPNDAAIAMAVISMAASMELSVVAEGVETSEQLEFLRRNRCDEVQGNYLSTALPADALADLVRARQAGRPLGGPLRIVVSRG